MENALLLCSLLPTSSYIYHVSLLKVPNFVGDYVYRCHDWVDMCNSRWSGQLRHKTVGVMSQAVERIEIVTFGGNIKPGWYAIFCLVPHMCLAKHVASDMVTRVYVPNKCVFSHVTHVYIYISNHLYTSCMAHKFENQFHNMQRCEMYNVCLFVVTKGCGSPETLEQSDPLFVD